MCTAAPPLMQVNEVVESGVLKLSPGIKELVGNLHSNGVAVFLISGGFIQMVTPIANMLNIPAFFWCLASEEEKEETSLL